MSRGFCTSAARSVRRVWMASPTSIRCPPRPSATASALSSPALLDRLADCVCVVVGRDDASDYEAFRGLVALDINSASDSDTQFDFQVDVFIGGMERRLARA